MFLQSEDENGLPTAQQAEKKRKERRGEVYLPGVRRGPPGGAVRSQVPGERGKLGEVGEWQCEVRWGARRVVEGEHRAPWAMLVEGNGGISKRQLEFEEKERNKIGNFGKHASTSVSIAASSETLVQAEGGLRGGVSHCREGGL